MVSIVEGVAVEVAVRVELVDAYVGVRESGSLLLVGDIEVLEV